MSEDILGPCVMLGGLVAARLEVVAAEAAATEGMSHFGAPKPRV